MARHSRSDLGLVGTRLERASLLVIKLNELGQQLLPNTRDRHQIALCGKLHQLYQAMHVFSNVFHASALIISDPLICHWVAEAPPSARTDTPWRQPESPGKRPPFGYGITPTAAKQASSLGGYIPVLGWGGANHEFPCMHITSYSGPERQREPRSGFRICLAVVCEEL
jgi:hypothetical protein